ncbi:VOC family protein [Leucobacter sp. GX24907]
MNESAPSSIQSHKYVYALDCPDAQALGEFYARLLGWRTVITPEYSDWVSVVPPEGKETGFEIACQEIGSYRAPEWPDGPIPQQAHLDFYVESLDASTAIAEAAGATRHSHQPSEAGTFIVLVDPVGHPFCLCQA